MKMKRAFDIRSICILNVVLNGVFSPGRAKNYGTTPFETAQEVGGDDKYPSVNGYEPARGKAMN